MGATLMVSLLTHLADGEAFSFASSLFPWTFEWTPSSWVNCTRQYLLLGEGPDAEVAGEG